MNVFEGRYVGDNYDKDVVGAQVAGMKSLFLVRSEHGDHPLQQRKRRLRESDLGSEAPAEEEGEEVDDEAADLRKLLARFPAADMAAFDLRPDSILSALRDWERRSGSYQS